MTAATYQRDAQDVHATGPTPGPQYSGRRDYVQRDRVRPGGRRVPQPDQARPVGHHRVPVDRVRRVRRPLHGHAAVPTGTQVSSGLFRVSSTVLVLKNQLLEVSVPHADFHTQPNPSHVPTRGL